MPFKKNFFKLYFAGLQFEIFYMLAYNNFPPAEKIEVALFTAAYIFAYALLFNPN